LINIINIYQRGREMNYRYHYDSLINRAAFENRKKYKKSDSRYVYYEKHHIIPECFFINRKRKGAAGWLKGNPNSAENLVLLKPEEHYVAHQLLVKIYPENMGLVFAAVRMTMSKDGQRMNNKLYSWLRKRIADNSSRLHREKKIGMHGKKHTEETKQKMRDSSPHTSLKGFDSPSYGLKRPEETCNKISRARTGVSTGARTEETKQKMRAARKNQTRTRDMPITVDGVLFSSATKASASVGITVSALCKRMRSGKYPNYVYANIDK
jgi:hypothetical protein